MKQKKLSKQNDQAVPSDCNDHVAALKFLFGRNITKGSKSDVPDGEKYRIAVLPDALTDRLTQAEKAEDRAERRSKLPIALSVVKYICLIVGLTVGTGIFKSNVSLVQGYRNAPYFYWIAGVCLLVGGLLWLIGLTRDKHLDQKKPVLAARKALREAENGADAYLSVPENAKKADVLLVEYCVKDGEAECKGPAWLFALRLYCQDDAICLTDGKAVYAIEKNKLRALRLVERSTAILNWNKEEKPSNSKFQKAGLCLKKKTPVGLRFYCALEWLDDNEIWQLLFPAYELQKIAALTGLREPKLPALPQTRKPSEPIKQRDDNVRPRFYWTIPKEEKTRFWSSAFSDAEFRMQHPKIYTLLVVIAMLLLALPMFGFVVAASLTIPGAHNNPWLLLGSAGGFVLWIGLFNIIGAWLHQYLGHWVTIICIGLGAAMMTASWLLLLR